MATRRALAAAVMAALLITMAFGGADALAKRKSPTVRSLNSLVKQTRKLPKRAAKKAKRRKLLRLAKHARRNARRHPCRSVRDLNKYRRVLTHIHVKKGKRNRRAAVKLAALGPASLKSSRLLLSSKKTKRCGGGVKPSKRKRAKVKILRNTPGGFRVRVTLPKVNFIPKTGGGKSWTQLGIAGNAPTGNGKPGIPNTGEVFGVPNGAKVSVDSSSVKSSTIGGVNVYPGQPDVVDTPEPNFNKPPFTNKPFTINHDAYNNDSLFPPKPATGEVLGNSRDVTIGGLQLPVGQYNPHDQTLHLITSLIVNVNFNGGPHTFNPLVNSPWEHAQNSLINNLLNQSIINSRFRFPFRPCGEEMLVITNPATLAAANTLATARRNAGLRVAVVETGTGVGQIGDTPSAIQGFIRGQLTRFACIHPSYVTIMGDDDLVPTFPGIDGIPSDLEYSLRNGLDELPDVAVGRIIGNDQNAVQTAVNKIVGYETHVPSNGLSIFNNPFLHHATVAAQFQDQDGPNQVNDGQENRTFVQFAETVRNGLANHGETVDRVYRDDPTTNPTKFNDGTSIPASLQKPAFAWNGTGADVTGDWNNGRFMMVHRDHGWSDGWGQPSYGTGDVDGLTNGALLPVLFSINCASAQYDTDETSFVGESLVNPNGGAVGAFGDTRNSPSWHNTQIALGFIDGLLPFVLPAEGSSTRQRVGQALITGKLRLAGLSSPTTDGSSRDELYLWHYFGDPSMQMWGAGYPNLLVTARQFQAFYKDLPGGDPPYEILVTVPPGLAGQVVSLLRDGQVIGKATVGGDGKATVPADFGNGSPNSDELQVAVEPDGGPPVKRDLSNETSMTQKCPASPAGSFDTFTVNGTLKPALANRSIVVTFTRPDDTTFTRTVQTDASGNWSASMRPVDEYGQTNGAGTWKAHARFGGDATHPASETADCTVQVVDNG